MSLPRRVLPGTTYLLTRRCAQRQLLLRPSPEVNQTFTYCFALAAERYGLRVHALTVLGNHVHAVCTDPEGRLPEHGRLAHGLVARALNVHLGRAEAFWAPGSFSAVALGDAEAVLERLVYTITNTVEAGLVADPAQWPGLRTLAEDVGAGQLAAARPRFFFRQREDDEPDGLAGEGRREETARDRARRRAGRRPVLPDVASVAITRPPQFADMTDDAFRELLSRRVAERVAEIHCERLRAGKTAFLGAAAVLAQSPFSYPWGGTNVPDGSLNPRLACHDRWRRAQMRMELATFWAEHRAAYERFREGRRTTPFPPGTYGARVFWGARVRGAA